MKITHYCSILTPSLLSELLAQHPRKETHKTSDAFQVGGKRERGKRK
jgi:hypothetical protein